METVKSSLLEATVKQMAELSDVQLEQMLNPDATPTSNTETVTTKSDEVWFPINVNFPSSSTPTAPAPGALTEEEKRKRLIIVMGALFASLILFLVIMAYKSKK